MPVDTDESLLTSRQRAITLVAVLAGAAVYVFWRIDRSLWLDEFGTFWVVSGGLRDAVTRAIHYQGQSPLYFICVWLVTQVFGHDEVALRILSLVTVPCSGYLIYRIGRGLGLRDGARAAALFGSIHLLMDFNIGLNARPYALAILLSLVSIYSLQRWCSTKSTSAMICYFLATVATIYSHYLFASILLFHAAYVVFERYWGNALRWSNVAVAALSIAVLLMPSLYQMQHLHSKVQIYQLPGSWSTLLLVLYLFSPSILVVLAVVIFSRTVFERTTQPRRALQPSLILLLLVWWATPPLFFYLAYYATGVTFHCFRYFVWNIPAVALLFGTCLEDFRRGRIPLLFVSILCLIPTCLFLPIPPAHEEDWRGAADYLRPLDQPASPLLLYNGLIESVNQDWITSPERSGYMTAAVRCYGWKNRVCLLPYDLSNHSHKPYLRNLCDELKGKAEVPVVVRHFWIDMVDGQKLASERMVEHYFREAGFDVREIRAFQDVTVLILASRQGDS